MKKKAIIVSLKSFQLSRNERILLSKEKPWGIILFKRNFRNYTQAKKLTSEIRKLTKDKQFPIIVDEEGLSVSRLKNFFNHNINANFFGDLYKINDKIALNLYFTFSREVEPFSR